MSLVDLWQSSREQIEDKHVQQLIAVAGEGKLRDGSEAAKEFREFLTNINSDRLRRYAMECLASEGFADRGLVLQDVVNEIGRRLDYEVQNGRYRGTAGDTVGFDGLWRAPEGHEIVVEVKTSDFRINLETVARYRKELINRDEIEEDQSSILFVVAHEDTGDLEAQIRGSRYAWDIRLISVDALLRLLSIREDLEDPSSAKQVRSILIPREYTRVDGIIDLVFSAKKDILQEDVEEDEEDEEGGKKFTPVSFHEACVERIQKHIEENLIKRSRATYSSPNESVALICLVSKEYDKGAHSGYWFGFHPHQQEKLAEAEQGYLAFGCGSPETVLLLPLEKFEPLLPKLNQTHQEDRQSFWHVIIRKHGDQYRLRPKAEEDRVDFTPYLLEE